MPITTRVIAAQGDGKGMPFFEEALAAVASTIKPGHLVVRAATGEVDKHVTAGGTAQAWVADTNLMIATDTDTVYTAGDTVRYGVYSTGQKVFVRVAAAAAAIVIGDRLQSAGDGTVQVFVPQVVDEGGVAMVTIQPNNLVGFAVEAIDNSGGASEVFVEMRVA